MNDPTEGVRRIMTDVINSEQAQRQELEQKYGTVWNTEELTRDFEVFGFLAPYVAVKRKSDGKKGSLLFQHAPRFYFSFTENK
jgi:hypothetical protein